MSTNLIKSDLNLFSLKVPFDNILFPFKNFLLFVQKISIVKH